MKERKLRNPRQWFIMEKPLGSDEPYRAIAGPYTALADARHDANTRILYNRQQRRDLHTDVMSLRRALHYTGLIPDRLWADVRAASDEWGAMLRQVDHDPAAY